MTEPSMVQYLPTVVDDDDPHAENEGEGLQALLDRERQLWHQMQQFRESWYHAVVAELERETTPHDLESVLQHTTAAGSYHNNLQRLRHLLWPPA